MQISLYYFFSFIKLIAPIINLTYHLLFCSQQRDGEDNSSLAAIVKNLRTKLPALPDSSVSQNRQRLEMTQSMSTILAKVTDFFHFLESYLKLQKIIIYAK